ncbi:DUF262 domain-containing protein [Helicobacter sp. MIT 05-5294]|uniref:DUF262 domain-containing protein n=1 Tax=Helicobacter sp. MIT 05-5294 TaxID=1548150 RepID=UPI00051FB785|nr:DUF262 domain-containing protein [Helicobacter sp. MIT 05-5294]TLD86165.1 DUF262 domain-containing protein [Helicobacter sp. MIT 05-5294]
MKANENNFGFMEQESLIEIPFFQRAYVWEEEQWEQLLEDLRDSYANKREHFLGSVVLKQLSTSAGEGTKRSLIDGQQRLTTFSILVKSLYDKLESDDKVDYANYLFKKPTKEKSPKIQHSKIDRISFNEILQAKDFASLQDIERYKEGKHKGKIKDKLIRCYEYFTEQINKEKSYKDFLNFILNSKLWVTINLDTNEDEQKIFDSINTAGLKLTATDIIKNALFAKAMELNSDYERLYQEYWECLFETKENKEFWEEEVSTGRLKRVQSEIFLHAFAIIGGFFDVEKDTLENLSDIYKTQIKNFDTKKLESFLKKIKEYALIYQNFPHITKETPLCFVNDEQRLFHILNITDTNTIMPLILALKLKLKNKDDALKDCLKLLEIFILTRWLCSESTKEYNKMFANITRKLDINKPLEFLRDNLKDIPKKYKIEDCLMSKDDYLENKKAALILFWIELYRRYINKEKQDSIELSYKWTLEHLMPESWEENWRKIAKDELHAEDLIYQIGNMTLLKGSLNSSIKNASWKIKLEGDGTRKNCIKNCADLLITREILDKKIWNEDNIRERTQKLMQDFFKIWDIEALQNKNQKESQW